METNEYIDGLVIKQLLFESTPDENIELAQWRAQSTEHEKYFQDFKTIWETSKNLEQASVIDENQSWKRFQERAASVPEQNIQAFPTPTKKNRWVWMKAAAAILVIIGGIAGYNLFFNPQEIQFASGNEVKIITLPDGSSVTLNKQSTLAYSKRFNEKERKITLAGEAFFNVVHNDKKPFKIQVGGLQVLDVGTSFNVKESSLQTEVIVESGIVKVFTEENSVQLLPKQKVIVHKNSNKFESAKNEDLLYNYYRTKTFTCYNTPLYELVEALNKTYDTQIVMATESTGNLRLTSTFKEMPLNEILKVVSETFNLKVEQQAGKIILR